MGRVRPTNVLMMCYLLTFHVSIHSPPTVPSEEPHDRIEALVNDSLINERTIEDEEVVSWKHNPLVDFSNEMVLWEEGGSGEWGGRGK
jgi:hypothetical protein